MNNKLLYSLGAAVVAALFWMGAQSGTEIRRGGGGGPGFLDPTNFASALATNLQASAASISRSTTVTLSHPNNPTNVHRLLTNVFDTSFSTNMAAVTSATNGFIRITNNGVYVLSAHIIYRVSVPSAVFRTNIFFISTNSTIVGTNNFILAQSTPNTNVNQFNFVAMEGQTFLASNTFVSFGVVSPINIASTNDISIERVYLSAEILPGSPIGSGGTGSGINIGFNSTQFSTNGGILSFISDGKLTNVTVESGMIVATGNFTNNGDAYLLNGITRIQSGGASLNLGYLATADRVLYANSGKTVAPVTSSDPTNELVKANGTAIPVSTNSFHDTSGLYSKGLFQSRNEFWDDFDGPDMGFGEFLQRKSPSGHTYRLHAIDPAGTNGFRMTRGRLVQTNHLDTPVYVSISNTMHTSVKPWNRFGASIIWRSNAPPTTFLGEFGLIIAPIHDIFGAGEFLHTYTDMNGSPVAQRSLTSDILFSEDNGLGQLGSGTFHNGNRVLYELNIFSNTLVMQIGGWLGTVYRTNLSTYSRWPVSVWELFGSATNEVQPEIESIWAGYADPALEILAAGPRKIGTNYAEVTEITTSTLVGADGGAAGGTFTNRERDTIIAFTNALASDSTARTNKLWHHTNGPGKEVIIIDAGRTATGTNLVIETTDGSLIYPGGSVRTNITENSGSIKLVKLLDGWYVLHRSTTGGGSGTPSAPDTSVQFNNGGSFGGDADYTYNSTSNNITLLGGLAVSRPGINISNTVLAAGLKIDYSSVQATDILRLGGGGTGTSDFDWSIDQSGNFLAANTTWIHGYAVAATMFSNKVYNIPGAASVVTIYGSNQVWQGSLTTNVTFADSSLGISNVYYFRGLTNSATISYPLTWRWRSGSSFTSGPTFANQGGFEFKVWVDANGTNAAEVVGQELELVAGANLTATTNNNQLTLALNPQLTNIAGINNLAETRLIPTNSALSNIVVNFAQTNIVELWITNNVTFTNWSNIPDFGATPNIIYLIRPVLINRGVNWGNLGLSNPGYNVAIGTNINAPMWTTLTNGKTYSLTITRVRTNLFPVITLWE